MEFVPTPITGAFEIRLKVHADSRGRFKRHYCEQAFGEAGLATHYVQMNHSVTVGRFTVRGLHYQVSPHCEDKLVSCTFGQAFDVAVDLRQGSPTFLKWARVELDERTMFYIPKGCAHGFQSLSDETHLLYLHSAYYAPDAEGGLRFDDPAIGVEWPHPVSSVSDRDRAFDFLRSDFKGISA